jgi:hypothetical protein
MIPVAALRAAFPQLRGHFNLKQTTTEKMEMIKEKRLRASGT